MVTSGNSGPTAGLFSLTSPLVPLLSGLVPLSASFYFWISALYDRFDIHHFPLSAIVCDSLHYSSHPSGSAPALSPHYSPLFCAKWFSSGLWYSVSRHRPAVIDSSSLLQMIKSSSLFAMLRLISASPCCDWIRLRFCERFRLIAKLRLIPASPRCDRAPQFSSTPLCRTPGFPRRQPYNLRLQSPPAFAFDIASEPRAVILVLLHNQLRFAPKAVSPWWATTWARKAHLIHRLILGIAMLLHVSCRRWSPRSPIPVGDLGNVDSRVFLSLQPSSSVTPHAPQYYNPVLSRTRLWRAVYWEFY